MAMNSSSLLRVGTPAAFHEQTLATRARPGRRGKPDPGTPGRIRAESIPRRAGSEPGRPRRRGHSLANTDYNGVARDPPPAADGTERLTPLVDASARRPSGGSHRSSVPGGRGFPCAGPAQPPHAGPAALGPGGDDSPSRSDNVTVHPSPPWPAGRAADQRRHAVGHGDFRSGNGRLPGHQLRSADPARGVAASDDPALAARSGVYSESFNRREIEIARGKAAEAVAAGTMSSALQPRRARICTG